MDVMDVMDATEAAYVGILGEASSVRNSARAWLAAWVDGGTPLSARGVATIIGISGGRTMVRAMWALVRVGVVRRPKHGTGGAFSWGRAAPGDGIDCRRLLDMLGRTLEPSRRQNMAERRGASKKCLACHYPLNSGMESVACDGAASGICHVCAEIEKIPQLKERLDYFRARADAGLPLFSPSPPWVTHDAEESSAKRRSGEVRNLKKYREVAE